MKSAVATLILAATAATAQITLNTPSGATGAIQCEVYQVSWTGGTAPFDIRLNDAANNFIEEVGSNVQSSPFQWTVNQPAGQAFALVLLDSTGATGLSGQFTIQGSSNTACLSASASTGGSSTAAAASGSSTGAAATTGSASASASGSKAASGSSAAASATGSAAGSTSSNSAAIHNTVGAGLVGAFFAAAAALF
ncbi:hypothetical protein PENSPDRAFT_693410 [Peniophora sp. CONT]|nr:hypothetical protein PENSPDRAFT_693410 [Peniophora sp. CONT]